MGSQMELFKDSEGINHLIFDKEAMFDDSIMGDKLADFEVLQVLGAYNNKNIVSKVRSLHNNKIYTIKKIELKKIENDNEKQLCLQQMEELKKINHHHLLKYYKYFIENDNLYMVYEFMNNSDLFSFIKAHQILEKDIKEEEIWNILLQCLSGLNYLHKKGLSHLAIKPTNIFLNNQQNAKIGLLYDTPKLEDKNYDIKKDIYFLGLYFYAMFYANFYHVNNSRVKWIEDIDDTELKENKTYSLALKNIIGEMVKDQPGERKSAEELLDLVKSEYVKKYTRISSIQAVLNCLFAFTDFKNAFLKTENYILINKDRCHISYWFLKTLKVLEKEEQQNLNECFEEFKRVIASENTKIDGSKEVHPVYLLSFLFEKLHKEGNKRIKTEINQNKKLEKEQYVLNSRYKVEEEDDKSNKVQMLHNFFYYFKENVHSIISDFFFGFMKMKRNCFVCRNANYSFSNFSIVPFDLSKCDNNKVFNLIVDGFAYNHNYDKKDRMPHIFCDRCLTEQPHYEFNRFYCMSVNLTLFFYRGKNFQSNANVDFSEQLDIRKYTEDPNLTPLFELIGSINRVVKDEKEEFIYYIKDPNSQNIWKSSNGDICTQNAPIKSIQNCGQIILLFYKSLK